MPKERRRRTAKVFVEYNDYRDRGMVKWITAFAMEEVVKSIVAGKKEAMKDVPLLPQMDAFAIDAVLVEAVKSNRPVAVQLNQKDHLGRQTESIRGHFNGYLADNSILIGEGWIPLESIRNAQILNEDKWFKIDGFSPTQKNADTEKQKSPLPSCFDSEEQDFFGSGGSWAEGLCQDGEWME